MKIEPLFLDIAPAYISFEFMACKGDGTAIDPTGTPTLSIYEEGGADGTYDNSQGTGSPFNLAKINSITGNYGVLVDKTLFTVGKLYRCIYNATVDGIATKKVELLQACNASQFKATGFSTHSAADVWSVETRALTDKVGFGLASTERVTLAASQSDYAPLKSSDYTAPDNTSIGDIKTEVLTHPTLAEIEASTILAKEATLNTKASQTSVNGIPTNPLLTTDSRLNNLDATISSRSTLTATDVWASANRTLTSFGTLIADVWSYATRKLTSRNIGVGENIAQEETQIAEHDATQAAIAAIPSPPSALDIDNQLSTTHGAGAWEHLEVGGANQVTLKAQFADLTPILEATIQVFNSTQTVLLASGITDSIGQKIFALNDGTYKIRISKAGYSFTVPETIIVSGNGTFTFTGSVAQTSLRDL